MSHPTSIHDLSPCEVTSLRQVEKINVTYRKSKIIGEKGEERRARRNHTWSLDQCLQMHRQQHDLNMSNLHA
jgi:hypothetical protein